MDTHDDWYESQHPRFKGAWHDKPRKRLCYRHPRHWHWLRIYRVAYLIVVLVILSLQPWR
jgi:hypothetical protein